MANWLACQLIFSVSWIFSKNLEQDLFPFNLWVYYVIDRWICQLIFSVSWIFSKNLEQDLFPFNLCVYYAIDRWICQLKNSKILCQIFDKFWHNLIQFLKFFYWQKVLFVIRLYYLLFIFGLHTNRLEIVLLNYFIIA